ncbi:MAG TPA: hypothetical protein VNU71_16435 [Burkholderiaceae bacterium]|nr:hypothetical protein [Burkholderiaceae bacterium]
MSTGVDLVVRAVELRVRDVRLRLPFRFGASTLTACPQLFVRAEVEVPGHGRATGFAAEMMVPKWFDKRAAFTPDANLAHLARAARSAAAAYTNDAPATAFGLFARHYGALMADGAAAGLTELSAAFGQAVLDKAVVDALCRALDASFFEAVRRNAIGLVDDAAIADMAGWDWTAWLATLRPLHRIEARHTVGLLDEIDAVRFEPAEQGGLPISLPAVIERYGHRCFKIKLGGDPRADLERLRAVLAVLDATVGDYRYTLDGNEQYASRDALDELLAGLAPLRAPLYLEQPVPRELSLAGTPPAGAVPLLMDEADGTLDAFPRARDCGWRGVSSKSCKGLYKALVNRARCERWNLEVPETATWFMSAEDLTCQAGLAVQQDLALAALLGLDHAERNGHHYGRGFGDAPAAEQGAFAAAHPDLYESRDGGAAQLCIRAGAIELDSLFAAPGFAHRADPDWRATLPLTL